MYKSLYEFHYVAYMYFDHVLNPMRFLNDHDECDYVFVARFCDI